MDPLSRSSDTGGMLPTHQTLSAIKHDAQVTQAKALARHVENMRHDAEQEALQMQGANLAVLDMAQCVATYRGELQIDVNENRSTPEEHATADRALVHCNTLLHALQANFLERMYKAQGRVIQGNSTMALMRSEFETHQQALSEALRTPPEPDSGASHISERGSALPGTPQVLVADRNDQPT